MATHPSVLAWRIPGTGRLVGCSLWGHTESDTTEATQQQQQQQQQVCHGFSSKEQAFFNFVAVVTIHSDIGTQENKVSHGFHFSPIYLP